MRDAVEYAADHLTALNIVRQFIENSPAYRRRVSMKTKMMFTSLALCVAMCCDVYGSGLLNRMLGRDGGGCGCDSAPAATCCDTPARCRSGFKLNLNCGLRLPKLLNRGCCDSGNACDSGNSCGCNAPAAAPACDSGCGNACGGGLLSGRSGFGLRRGCNTG